jgi:hypothetical protein
LRSGVASALPSGVVSPPTAVVDEHAEMANAPLARSRLAAVNAT